ncbi:MAG TPA: transcription elongation factor GreA [Polyangia bacterium]|jgi:transcription elongation factor GreA|nr:transcription elongation factor GreA [Polyangia bacterium]
MADTKIPMTPRGLILLKEELKRRKEVERPKIVRDIEEARAHGDLSENAEYSAAKEAQSFNEGRIKELEGTIALANVIDPSKLSGEKVVFGATVELSDAESGEDVVYTIVGEHEADIKQGRISITAPVARALIGRTPGDTVQVRTPKGAREYEILAVRFEGQD